MNSVYGKYKGFLIAPPTGGFIRNDVGEVFLKSQFIILSSIYKSMPRKYTRKRIEKIDIIDKEPESIREDNSVSPPRSGSRLSLYLLLLVIAVIAIAAYNLRGNGGSESGADNSAHQGNTDQQKSDQELLKNQEQVRPMGILTFFHSAPLIGQIKVFGDWEGKYRVKDEGNKASFAYIGNQEQSEPEIFSIAYYPVAEWSKNKKNYQGRELLVKDDTVFLLTVGTGDSLSVESALEYNAMIKDVDTLIKTFKAVEY